MQNHTGEISLERFNLSDCESLVRLFADEEIHRYIFDLPRPYTLEHAKDWVLQNEEQYKQGPPENFSIKLNRKVYIGSIGLKWPFEGDTFRSHQVEIGYVIAKEHWGKGYATAAIKLFTTYIFNTFEVERVFACVFTGNDASDKALLKSGFKQEGILRKFAKKGDKYLDCKLFARLRDDNT